MSRLDPHAEPQEVALLGACLVSDLALETARELVDADDFYAPKHRHIYAAIIETARTVGRADTIVVAEHLAATGLLDSIGGIAYLHQLQNGGWTTSNAHQYANAIAAASLRRQLIHAASEITEHAYNVADAATVADRARDLVARLDMPTGKGAPDPDIDTFIGDTDVTYDWLIPDVLERRDRILVTAGEGMGKSVMLAQFATMTAAGIHPWTYESMTPRNVLVVDLENQPRLVTRRFTRLRQQAVGLDPQRLRIHARPEGIDLTTRTDRRWLIDRCQANAAELLVIGPAYRMSAGVAERGDIGGENQARTVTRALDEVRNRCDVALLMETHAPHGNISGRDLRPFGSSVWLRWPEFGIGFAHDSDHPGRWKVSHWRGPRDERLWPSALERGGRWPWTPILPAQRWSAA